MNKKHKQHIYGIRLLKGIQPYHQIGVYSYCYKGEGQPMVVFRPPTFGGGKVPQIKETTIHFKWRYIKQYVSCMSKFGFLKAG
jgi:hypothetical protein